MTRYKLPPKGRTTNGGKGDPNDALFLASPAMAGKLSYHAETVNYYRALAAKTPRVKVFSIGTTDEVRECVVVAVGSEESIKNIDQYRAYLAQLADPRKLTDEQAREIIAKAKPIYHVMGGLHSSETEPTEMLMELAYRIATEDSPVINQIRDNVIVTITPVAEPDGRDRYVDWYYRYKIDEKTDSFAQRRKGGRQGAETHKEIRRKRFLTCRSTIAVQ